jgi:hypothetical protein
VCAARGNIRPIAGDGAPLRRGTLEFSFICAGLTAAEISLPSGRNLQRLWMNTER